MKQNQGSFIDFPKNFDYKTHQNSNHSELIEPKIVIQYILVSLFHYSANTFKMYMTLRAAQFCLAGHMRPVGRKLESPDVMCRPWASRKKEQKLLVLSLTEHVECPRNIQTTN